MYLYILAFLLIKGHKALMFWIALSIPFAFQRSVFCMKVERQLSLNALVCSNPCQTDKPEFSCSWVTQQSTFWFVYLWYEIVGALAKGVMMLFELDALCIAKLTILWNHLGGKKKSMLDFSGWKGKLVTQLSTRTQFLHSSCHVLLDSLPWLFIRNN